MALLRGADVPRFDWIPPVLGTIVFAYGGWVFLQGRAGELAQRLPGMMTLISLAILVAFVASWAATLGIFEVDVWWELATLITIMLPRPLDRDALDHAGAAARLSALAAAAARHRGAVDRDGDDRERRRSPRCAWATSCWCGPGARVPADGPVVDGSADVDESMITGESRPVAEAAGDRVVAGTVATARRLRVRVDGASATKRRWRGSCGWSRRRRRRSSRAQVLADRAAALLFYVALGAGGDHAGRLDRRWASRTRR